MDCRNRCIRGELQLKEGKKRFDGIVDNAETFNVNVLVIDATQDRVVGGVADIRIVVNS